MSLLTRFNALIRGNQDYVATVDAAKAAPPPSPLAPVDLTDPAQVTGVMDIAARIGALLISSGTANSDARAQIHLAASAYGLHYCHIDIVMNTVTIHTSIGTGSDRQPLHLFRVAPRISLDFQQLASVDRLIRSIMSGSTPPAMAERILDEIESQKPIHKYSTILLAWGAMGGFITMYLGGDLLVCIMAFVIAMLIMGINGWLSKFRLPAFYQNMVGGFIAVMPAAILYDVASYFGYYFAPSQLIGMGILVLVAGLTLVQCLVDGITGAPVTSAARCFEAIISTGAIIAGVGMGITFADFIGFGLPPLATIAPPVYYEMPVLILGGAVGSAAFALACYASWKEVIISGLTAACAIVFFYLIVIPFGVGPVVASGISAVVVGLAGGLMSRRFLIPPLVTMIIGYTPMLPGLTLYRGMYATLNDQIITGLTNLMTAVGISGALAAGVVLGERGARRLRRPKIFRPYSEFKRKGRFTFRRTSFRPRIPRVPLSPFAPKVNQPSLPPVEALETNLSASDVRKRQDDVATEAWSTGEYEDQWPEETHWPSDKPGNSVE